MEDFLLFIRFFSFLSLQFLADFVFIKDPIVRVSFHNNSHSYRLLLRSLFRYKSILSLPLAQLLLFGSEYNGSHLFALKASQKKSPTYPVVGIKLQRPRYDSTTSDEL